MKATGILRKVDNVGRISIPMELRRQLDINAATEIEEGDALEIYQEGNKIILEKYQCKCIFCGETDNCKLINYMGKKVCTACIPELKRVENRAIKEAHKEEKKNGKVK